jgi:hypothetical protein
VGTVLAERIVQSQFPELHSIFLELEKLCANFRSRCTHLAVLSSFGAHVFDHLGGGVPFGGPRVAQQPHAVRCGVDDAQILRLEQG